MPVAMCRESWCVPLWECVMTRRWPCPVVPGRLQARSPVLQISVTVASWRALPERVAVRRPGVPPPDQVSLRSLVDNLLDLAAVEVESAAYGALAGACLVQRPHVCSSAGAPVSARGASCSAIWVRRAYRIGGRPLGFFMALCSDQCH